MKQVIYFFCFVLLVSTCYSQGKTLTLKQSIETAIANNLQIKQGDLQAQTAAVNLRQAKGNVLPDLFGLVGQGINQGRSIDPFTNGYIDQQVNYGNYNLSTSVTLFNGLQLQHTIRQNALAYEATKMEWQQTRDNVILNVILAYLQILNNEDQLAQSQNQAEITRKQVERLSILNREGAISPALFYDLKGQLANDELAIINSRNTLQTARITLLQLLNIPYDKDVQVEKLTADQLPSGHETGPDQIYEHAGQALAMVKAAELRRLSAAKGVQAARGNFYPRLGLSGNLFTNFSSAARRDVFLNTTEVPSGDFVEIGGNKISVLTRKSNYNAEKIGYIDQFNNNYSTSVSIGLRIPLLNAFSARNQLAQAKINLKNAEYIEQATKVQLKQAIEQAYFNMTAAYERYKTLQQQVADFTESFRAAEVRFNAGASTQIDYLVAKNNVDRANINLIIARYDYILRAKMLDYYQGKLSW